MRRWPRRAAARCARRRLSGEESEWPKPRSPEWLALSRRPFFGIPADDEPPVWKRRKTPAPPWVGAAKSAPEPDDAPGRGSPWRHLARPPPTATPPNRWAPPRPPPASARLEKMRAFRMTPAEIKAALDTRVVGQEAAKRAVAVAVAEHYHHARRCIEDPSRKARTWHKKNLLLLGPSGSGKTQLCRALADVVDAAYVRADATKYSATGYVGRDVEELVTSLVDRAGDDAEAAEFGLVHVDEIDKVCVTAGGVLDGGSGAINTRDVQTSLLKLMEDGEVPLAAPPMGSYQRAAAGGGARAPARTFSTKHVLFVFSGAFERLRARLGAAPAGAADLVDAGLLPEFVGRVPVRCALEPLTVADLVAILAADSDTSPLRQSADAFEAHGIALTHDDAALEAVARAALDHGLGARSLVTELDATLRDFAYHLPGSGVDALHLDAALVDDPAAALERLLPGADRGPR